MDPSGSIFEQHPVPQNISSYQFRLVGDMTIKQFFQLAGGALIALLFYASPLPGFLKWPFIIVFVLGGAAFAFLPIQERPLEVWVKAFARSVYAPTLYKWSKTGVAPKYFQPAAPKPITAPAPAKSSPADDMTKSLTTGGAHFLQSFEDTEKQMLNKFTQILSQAADSAKASKEASLQAKQSVSTIPVAKTPAPSMIITDIAPVAPPTNIPAPQVPGNKTLFVPISGSVQTTHQGYQQGTVTTPTKVGSVTNISQVLTSDQSSTLTNAPQFSPDAAPPIPPTQPNIIVGQVIDDHKKIIEGAILEIKDTMNRPIRALRSNKAGHFQIVTPLNNGSYTIYTEKDGFHFTPVALSVQGTIIPPMVVTGMLSTKPKT